MKYISQILNIALRELGIIVRKNQIYGFCMIVFPLVLVLFFTTMLDEGIPKDLPLGRIYLKKASIGPRFCRDRSSEDLRRRSLCIS